MQTILFLCTGNYYRSRFAEIYFNWHAEKLCLNWRADSRGLALDARNMGPISIHTLSCLEKLGIPSPTHERFPLAATDSDFSVASRIIAVKEAEHRRLVERRYGGWRDKVEYWHVHDVDCALPDAALPHLRLEVQALLDGLSAMAA